MQLSVPVSRVAACAVSAALALAGCGDKTPKKAAEKPSAGAAKAEPAKPKPAPKPQPPKVQLRVEKLLQARVIERCALKHGESDVDAHTVAIDFLAGRPYQPPKSAPKPAAAPKGDAKAAAPAKGDPKQGAKGAEAPAAPKPGPADEAPINQTPNGRNGLDPGADNKIMAAYSADVPVAEGWKPWKDAMDRDVEACAWAPKLGLVDAKLVSRYVSAFVAITCLQEQHRKPGGDIDEIAHARAAVGVFQQYDFDARQFAELGLVMAKLPKVQAQIHAARAKACPDPRIKAAQLAAEGAYQGKLSGTSKGAVTLKASGGKLSGTVTVAKRRKRPAVTLPATGNIDGDRVHVNASQGQDWLRLDCRAGSDLQQCTYTGEVGFKKQKGSFTLTRPPPPKVEDAPVAASPDAPVPAKAAPAGAGVPAPLVPDGPTGDPPEPVVPTEPAKAPAAGAAPTVPGAKVPTVPVAGKPAAK